MKVGLFAAAAVAILLVVAAGGYLVGKSSAPTASDARDAQQTAFSEAFRTSATRATAHATKVAFVGGQRDGRQAGSDDGSNDASAQIAASQAASTAPGTLDQFGIARPAPGVSPEYDNCIAQGGTPSPDGCLP